MNYRRWLNGGCGCGCNNGYSKVSNCDCDTINLNISNLKTDVNVLSGNIEQINEYLENTVSIDELEDYYTKDEVDSKGYITNADLSDYATKSYVNSQGFLTEHQPLKTINNQSLIGNGNIVIEGSGGSVDVDSTLDPTSTNPVENKAIVEALNGKLDASEYTPTDLSNYYTKPETSGATEISAALNAKADTATTYTKSEVDAKDGVINDNVNILRAITNNKQDKLTAGDNISIVKNVISATVPSNVYTKTEVDNLVNNKIICLTQAQYDALSTKAPDTLYLIYEV